MNRSLNIFSPSPIFRDRLGASNAPKEFWLDPTSLFWDITERPVYSLATHDVFLFIFEFCLKQKTFLTPPPKKNEVPLPPPLKTTCQRLQFYPHTPAFPEILQYCYFDNLDIQNVFQFTSAPIPQLKLGMKTLSFTCDFHLILKLSCTASTIIDLLLYRSHFLKIFFFIVIY